MSDEKIVLSVANIKADLANGVTRLKSDKHYHADRGSIEEKYGLTPSEVRQIFKEPLLQGVRLVPYVEKRWELIPDVSDTTAEENVEIVVNQEEQESSQELQIENVQEEITQEDSVNTNEDNLF